MLSSIGSSTCGGACRSEALVADDVDARAGNPGSESATLYRFTSELAREVSGDRSVMIDEGLKGTAVSRDA